MTTVCSLERRCVEPPTAESVVRHWPSTTSSTQELLRRRTTSRLERGYVRASGDPDGPRIGGNGDRQAPTHRRLERYGARRSRACSSARLPFGKCRDDLLADR